MYNIPMSLKIITVPNPKLRLKSKPVKRVDKKLLQLIEALKETLLKSEDPPGVGLSAPQVSKNWQIFLTYFQTNNRFGIKPNKQIKVYLNPQIIKQSKRLTFGPDKDNPLMEGCLSIPKIYGPVKRYQTIKLKYQVVDPKSKQLVEEKTVFKDFAARVAQHELDHLNGILFTDRVKDQTGQLYVLENDRLKPILDR